MQILITILTTLLATYLAKSKFADRFVSSFDRKMSSLGRFLRGKLFKFIKVKKHDIEHRKMIRKVGGVVPLYDNRNLRVSSAESKSPNDSKVVLLLNCFRFLLPSKHREEFSGDITEIYNTLKEEGRAKGSIYFVVFLNIANVLYSTARLSLSEYFAMARSTNKDNS